MLTAYRTMACYWYSNNFCRDSWCWEAWRQLMTANQQNSLNDRDSFMRLASGYANRTESTSLFGSYTIGEALVLADNLFDFESCYRWFWTLYDPSTQSATMEKRLMICSRSVPADLSVGTREPFDKSARSASVA
jgi:hypothetical protein